MSQDTTKSESPQAGSDGALSESAANGLSIIEQFSQTEICSTRNRPFLRGVNHSEKRAVFFQPRCKLWACPHCGQINRKLWSVRAYHGAMILSERGNSPQDNLITFLTLTSNAKLDADASVRIFSSAWNNLLRRARRSGSQGQYLLVPERHKDGRVHAHAVTTFNLGSRWWKDNAAEIGLGYIAEEEEAKTPGGAASYVSKYLSKSLGVDGWPKYWRRIRASRQWPKMPELETPEGWRWQTLPKADALGVAIGRLETGGYEVALLDHIEAWTYVGLEG